MQNIDSGSHGLRWGLIIGFVYCVALFLRFSVGVGNLVTFALITMVGFIVVVVLLFICGSSFRKNNGGYVEMKEVFKVMFIAVLLFELFYSVFSLVYLKYINPTFFDTFRLNNETFLNKVGQSQTDNEKMLSMIDQWGEQAKTINMFDFLKSYLYNVAITGVFALIFAFILKRKATTFQSENFN